MSYNDEFERIEQESRVAAFMRSIPPLFRNAEISDFTEGFQPKIQQLLEGHSALILGDNGLGKTHLAWALLKEHRRNGRTVYYGKAQLLLFEIKRQDNPYTYIDKDLDHDCLVIDEIDKIFESKADFIYINYLVDHRYEWGKQTVMLGNGTREQFITSLGQSIYSRLRGNDGMDIMLTGKDKRVK